MLLLVFSLSLRMFWGWFSMLLVVWFWLGSYVLLWLWFGSVLLPSLLFLCSISAVVSWRLPFSLIWWWGSDRFCWVYILCSIQILGLSLSWQLLGLLSICCCWMLCSRFLFFLLIYKKLYLSSIFSNNLPLVLIFKLSHSWLCALKSSSRICAESCSRRSLISSSVTWSVGVNI